MSPSSWGPCLLCPESINNPSKPSHTLTTSRKQSPLFQTSPSLSSYYTFSLFSPLSLSLSFLLNHSQLSQFLQRKMRILDKFLCVLIATILILSIFPCSNARTHLHKPKSTHKHNGRHISQSPLPSPPAEPPTYSGSGEPCVFNVRDYGAVGDGDSDDTQAFRDAWKEACSQENGVLLVPSDGVFTITSTIFSGPCQPGFILQVTVLSVCSFTLCSCFMGGW